MNESNISLVQLILIYDLLQVSYYAWVHLMVLGHQVDRFYCVTVEVASHSRPPNTALLLWILSVQVITCLNLVVCLVTLMSLVIFLHYLLHLFLHLSSLSLNSVTWFIDLRCVYFYCWVIHWVGVVFLLIDWVPFWVLVRVVIQRTTYSHCLVVWVSLCLMYIGCV